tara:strand:+ start:21578 stop:25045 length:3468 start_codon:yes stop_codon:yes gene_type:complete
MSSKKLAQTYQKKTDIQHILDAPDTYIGQVDEDEQKNWILKDDKFVFTNYTWIPGVYKLFDEGIVNCRDHYIRMKDKKGKNNIRVKNIEITVDKKTGVITLYNDGNGIDIEKHPEYNIWIPEMIFGHLRTSTNYDKNEKKIVGGKNGFGFKLVLIYSLWGKIETVDHIRKKKYTQKFENNLSKINKPSIKSCSSKPYTKVSWLPDYKRFGITNISDVMFDLFKKRTYDIAAVTDKSVSVKFNNVPVPIRTFEQYIDLYIGDKSETKRIYESSDGRWEYIVCLTPVDEFTHISFVNGISTLRGGKHVDYILKQITKKMQAYIEKKKKVKVKETSIKEQLMLFLNCVIENPSFDSQSKECMNTPVKKFGSKCEVSDKFIDKLAKMGVMEAAVSLNEVKENKLSKKSDGKKLKSLRGIPKLVDANWAGTSKSDKCILILCEGDSAKSGIMSGLSKEDRDTIGVFPLKGKLMNVKDMAIKRINDNAEIGNIKKIIGLQSNKTYNKEEVKKSLRYGQVVFMTDQDLDGSHIKGLCINLFHSQWNDLFKIDKFIGYINTPILKATKAKRTLSFYNESSYLKWKESNNDGKGWKIKYYKGLGTSTGKEFKEYFKHKKVISFNYTGNGSDDAIDKVFNKGRADDRKDWLGNYDKDNVLDVLKSKVNYEEFVDKEMIHFSKYDCERSIPNAIDGLKTSLRKILFAALKRNLTNEIKVAQFSGYVSEHSGYHHGEMSLNKAIIGMAQWFVGSNNINILMPNGQFGTRLLGGKDHASERYIFTLLNPIVKYLYPSDDLPLLNYLDDDGDSIEPDYYVPIIPMILVNGGKGIGTGYSYEGMCYNPDSIITYMRNKINKVENNVDINPYYENFKGTITKVEDTKYMIKGKYEVVSSDSIRVTELPIGKWTTQFIEELELLMDDKNKKTKQPKKPIVKNIKDMSTDALIDITIKFHPTMLGKLISKSVDKYCNQLEKTLKLYCYKSTTNMNLFNNKQQLKKYNTVYEIIDDYFKIRYDMYVKRKEYLIANLENIVLELSNKARFIKEQCEDVIDLRRKKKNDVIELLSSRNYDKLNNDNEYKYLRSMRIESVEEENMLKLLKDCDIKIKELEVIKKTTVEEMWISELDKLQLEYIKYKKDRIEKLYGLTKTKTKRIKKKIIKKIKIKKK